MILKRQMKTITKMQLALILISLIIERNLLNKLNALCTENKKSPNFKEQSNCQAPTQLLTPRSLPIIGLHPPPTHFFITFLQNQVQKHLPPKLKGRKLATSEWV